MQKKAIYILRNFSFHRKICIHLDIFLVIPVALDGPHASILLAKLLSELSEFIEEAEYF